MAKITKILLTETVYAVLITVIALTVGWQSNDVMLATAGALIALRAAVRLINLIVRNFIGLVEKSHSFQQLFSRFA